MASATVTRAPFGSLPDGRAVEIFTLANASGMRVAIATYGATIVSLEAPDRNGQPADVVLGWRPRPLTPRRHDCESNSRRGQRVGPVAPAESFALERGAYVIPLTRGSRDVVLRAER